MVQKGEHRPPQYRHAGQHPILFGNVAACANSAPTGNDQGKGRGCAHRATL
jgi:hypothetical protein